MGADSAGYALKEELKGYLQNKGYEVMDMGTDSDASCHYPLFASAVCEEVQKDPQNRSWHKGYNPQSPQLQESADLP